MFMGVLMYRCSLVGWMALGQEPGNELPVGSGGHEDLEKSGFIVCLMKCIFSVLEGTLKVGDWLLRLIQRP